MLKKKKRDGAVHDTLLKRYFNNYNCLHTVIGLMKNGIRLSYSGLNLCLFLLYAVPLECVLPFRVRRYIKKFKGLI